MHNSNSRVDKTSCKSFYLRTDCEYDETVIDAIIGGILNWCVFPLNLFHNKQLNFRNKFRINELISCLLPGSLYVFCKILFKNFCWLLERLDYRQKSRLTWDLFCFSVLNDCYYYCSFFFFDRIKLFKLMRDFYFWFIIYKIFLLFQVKVRLLWYFWFIFFFFLKNILFQNIFFFVFILFFILLMLVWEMLNIKTKHILLRFNFFFIFFNFLVSNATWNKNHFFILKKISF